MRTLKLINHKKIPSNLIKSWNSFEDEKIHDIRILQIEILMKSKAFCKVWNHSNSINSVLIRVLYLDATSEKKKFLMRILHVSFINRFLVLLLKNRAFLRDVKIRNEALWWGQSCMLMVFIHSFKQFKNLFSFKKF